ncbi:recombinase family protein [Hansschlegelia quercus]|uniref:Recombinase family protein n=1 Tax=Hansschlegelia quercus TaxID=2528245 RepID=A0A4Q9GNN1_9HYPH|nr:recombinase family protein [Hansschlegelia quercus]TBN53460.1 recombinase family protein [Hansschlegelia quercus]
MSRAPTAIRRCAVYTRVSTDHRLEQDFNSLDAQCEAAEAYVRSQAGEGWKLVKNGVFSDGGFSGGSMERPALQRLLDLIRSRGVDVIVVYKVDRLTRSLADFAKLVELFDANGVSFVSVTQSFNTTTSMGRLTLNMLLSFAQFEREVTGERIRDKIAASKKRGIWVGGVVPLGYRVEAKKLVVDEAEAATVRMIFERYLVLGSLSALQKDIRERGIVTRSRTRSSGMTIGGVPLTNGPLAYLLANRVYLGEINHKGQSYRGEHPPIIAAELFEAVAAKLAENRNSFRTKRSASGALLLGRLFDDRGNPMTPSVTNKKGIRYRYYVSCVVAQGRGADAGSVKRISAPQIEGAVIAALRSRSAGEDDDRIIVAEHLSQAIISDDGVQLSLANGDVIRIASPRRSSDRSIMGLSDPSALPMKAEARAVLLKWIAAGRQCVGELERGRSIDLDQLSKKHGCSRRHIERMIDYAFLAPDLVKAIADGRLPRGVSAKALADAPMLWPAQWLSIGLEQPAV